MPVNSGRCPTARTKSTIIEGFGLCLHISCLHDHSATAPVLELRPAALRSELAYRALRVSDSSPLASSGSLSKNFFSWQRGHAATWEQRTLRPFGMCVPSNRAKGETPCRPNSQYGVTGADAPTVG